MTRRVVHAVRVDRDRDAIDTARQFLVGFDERFGTRVQLEELKGDSGQILYRATTGDLKCLLTVAPLPGMGGAVARLRNEYQIRHSINRSWGVLPVAQCTGAQHIALRYEDPGGVLLSDYRARPTDRLQATAEILRHGLAVAAALDGMHRAGIIHCDLKPENILVDVQGRARLLGFGLAAPPVGVQHGPTTSDAPIQGTLAYMAPEKTGRTCYSLDGRADLYSLGIILYELLTGAQPFQASNAAEWVHCHLARRPVPPGEKRPQIPREVSGLVMKLLEKAPEDRIQTAAAVVENLSRCLSMLEGTEGSGASFQDELEYPSTLQFAGMLYGREGNLQDLEAAFERMQRGGETSFVLLSGPSGVGKSCLVDRFERSLHGQSALFAAGKFDQYLRDIPYQTLSQCLDALVRQIAVAESDVRKRWRNALLHALGDNGALMVNLVPALELLIGPQAGSTSVGPQEDQTRFRATLRRFLRVFATAEHPLVLFLDDIQWLDSATFELLRELAIDRDIPYLFFIAAYRDSDAQAAESLVPTLEVLRNSAADVVEIALHPLEDAALAQLVADAVGRSADEVEPLASYVREQTGGNPYFSIQLLRTLVDEKLIRYDRARRHWDWDLVHIRDQAIGENVVELILGRVRSLSDEARRSLVVLACLGTQVERKTLACMIDDSPETVDARMAEAVTAGLVVTRGDSYAFAHDRAQEAAYAMIDDADRVATHLRIAVHLFKSTPAERVPDLAFEIATHFMKAAPLRFSSEEALPIASLFELAGEKAKAASAYEAALKYFAVGARLAGSSTSHGDGLLFSLRRKQAECEFLTGQLETAERGLKSLGESATTLHESAEVAWLLVTLYTALDRSNLAIATCLEFLDKAGVPLQRHALDDEVRSEYQSLLEMIGEASIDSLASLGRLTDLKQIDVLNVLTAALPPAFFSDEKLVCLILCRMAKISVQFGNSDASALGYAYLGMVAGPVFGDYATGYKFGRLGLDLVDEGGLARYRPRVYMTFAYHVAPWTKPMDEGRDLLLRAFEVAMETGDLTYAGFSSCTLISTMLSAGAPLADVDRDCEIKLAHVKSTKFGLIVDIISAQRQLVRALRGETAALNAFDDASFSEVEFQTHLEENRSLDIAACWYWIRKLQLCVYAGAFDLGLEAASRAEPLLWSTAGHLELAEYHFFAGVAHAVCVASKTSDAAQRHLPALLRHTQQLTIWAQHSPENFESRAALLLAELARIDGRMTDSMREFERAISSASRYRHLHDEALAYERAANLHFAMGLSSMGLLSLTESARRYDSWGARGKVAAIAHAHPELVYKLSARSTEMAGVVTTSTRELDVDAIVHSLQAVREETSLPRIVEILMTIALEQASAEIGELVLPTERGLRCRAYAYATALALKVELRDEDAGGSRLPMSVIQAAIQRHVPIQIHDARERNEFLTEARFSSGNVRSVLCLPLMRQAEVIGILYLENNVAAGAFTPARISLLQLLASTAAIAIENASLDEKSALLKEIHHRVKNNLQLVSSLLSLQASSIEDASVSRLFAESRDRVRSMALVHENLYRAGNFARVSMAEHLRNLCAQLVRAYRPSRQQVDVDVLADSIELDINRAIACGLIVNELVSNALKHGFADGRSGAVLVRFESVDRSRCRLHVIDNGAGMPVRHHSDNTTGRRWPGSGIGMDLVEDLAHQLGGEVTVTTASGTSVAVCFSRADNEG